MATAALEYNGNTTLLTEALWRTEELPAALEERQLAMQRGAVVPSTLQGPRRITVTGQIYEDDADTVRATLDALDKATAVDEPKLLKLWSDRQIYAICENFKKQYVTSLGNACDIELAFFCPDPIWQSTTETTLTQAQGTNGLYNQTYSWGITYAGSAPFDPHLFFAMARTDNAIDEFIYYGPNMLTNTRFELGESASEDGIPDDWTALDYSGGEQWYSFTDPHACIIVDSSTGSEAGGIYQDVPFTEAAIVVSGRAEFCVVDQSGTLNTVSLSIQELNSAGAEVAINTTTVTQGTYTLGEWYTVEVENVTTNAAVATIRFRLTCTAVSNQSTTVIWRKPAWVRAATASWPGHFNNKSFAIAVPDSHWLAGEIYEVDCAQKMVRYMDGNDWQLGWDYFGGDKRFFQLDPSDSIDLHFSWTIDGAIRRTMLYRNAYWNA